MGGAFRGHLSGWLCSTLYIVLAYVLSTICESVGDVAVLIGVQAKVQAHVIIKRIDWKRASTELLRRFKGCANLLASLSGKLD